MLCCFLNTHLRITEVLVAQSRALIEACEAHASCNVYLNLQL